MTCSGCGDIIPGTTLMRWRRWISRCGISSVTPRACLSRSSWAADGGTRSRPMFRGLPRQTVAGKCDLAVEWQAKGQTAFKFAAAVSDAGILREMTALREALGPGARIAVDLHWKFEAAEAVRLIRQLEAHDLWFAEAPVAPEDIPGLARVAQSVGTPVAAGEEWRTVYDVRPRLEAGAVSILQPEMGHTGVTQFSRIATLAQAFHKQIIPHATISTGIFMAASLQASAAAAGVVAHEYQHSVFDRNLGFLSGDMGCADGVFRVPGGPGPWSGPQRQFAGDGGTRLTPHRNAEQKNDGHSRGRLGLYPPAHSSPERRKGGGPNPLDIRCKGIDRQGRKCVRGRVVRGGRGLAAGGRADLYHRHGDLSERMGRDTLYGVPRGSARPCRTGPGRPGSRARR